MASQFQPGDRIRIDFDGAEFEVTHRMVDHCRARVINPGFVGSNKAADLDRPLEFDPLTPKDKAATWDPKISLDDLLDGLPRRAL